MTTKRIDQKIDQTSEPVLDGPEGSAATVTRLVPGTRKPVRFEIRTGIKAGDNKWD